MILRKVTIDNKSDLEFVEKLYIESFPANERRPITQLHSVMEMDDRFDVFLLHNEDQVRVGFINSWTFDDFIFIEHFAISPEQRNTGTGQKALEAFIEYSKLPLIGEIELPNSSDFAARRVHFYERIGFKVWNLEYAQPPFESKYDAIPMLMITYGDVNLNNEFDSIRSTIYQGAYNVEDVTEFLNNLKK